MEKCATCAKECSPVLYRLKPDGTTEPLCQVCATRWLLSEEGWPDNKFFDLVKVCSPLGTVSWCEAETQREDKEPSPIE